jgi:hypothetical protein
MTFPPGRYEVTPALPPVLPAGEYALGVWVGNDHETFADRDVLRFPIRPLPHDRPDGAERRRTAQSPAVRWVARRGPRE